MYVSTCDVTYHSIVVNFLALYESGCVYCGEERT
jgi:hypothetical protein